MTARGDRIEQKRNISTSLSVVCMLLLIYGLLVLLGALFSVRQDTASPYYALGSSLIIATSVLMWADHKWALWFCFVSAILITADLVAEYILPPRAPLMSAHSISEIARTLLSIALCWGGFFWYKRWRRAGAAN